MEFNKIQNELIDEIDSKNPSPVSIVAERHGFTRQTVSRHLKKLVEEQIVRVKGRGKSISYSLAVQEISKRFRIADNLEEDLIWSEMMESVAGQLADNERFICQHGFTEMVNNAIEHSEGKEISIHIDLSVRSIEFIVSDDGVGIFAKVAKALSLPDPRQSLLELAKGKFTTDKERHSGEGIFFTSRMFDRFVLMSGSLALVHKVDREDWLIEDEAPRKGTSVFMTLRLPSKRTSSEVFLKYTDDHSFDKTCVPLNLARYGADELISRSQAKRVLARVDKFKTVVLDFNGVNNIGQAFADEIFRVYKRQHPGIELLSINTSADVARMISRALNHVSE
jgi:anti-sigma regulatory factor (Ser/Thr protein kinase)